MEKVDMEKVDIVAFARENGAFENYSPDDLQYIGDNVQEFTDITFHGLMFLDKFGFINTWNFKIDNHTGEIIPYEGGFKFLRGGFNPDEMRKKLAMVDKAIAARKSRTE